VKPTSTSKRKRGERFRLVAQGGDKYQSFEEAWAGARRPLAALIVEDLLCEEQDVR